MLFILTFYICVNFQIYARIKADWENELDDNNYTSKFLSYS